MLKIETIKLRAMIGFGYWRDFYNSEDHGLNGESHNVLFLFWHYQYAIFEKPEQVEVKKKSGFQGRLEAAMLEQRRAKGRIENRKL